MGDTSQHPYSLMNGDDDGGGGGAPCIDDAQAGGDEGDEEAMGGQDLPTSKKFDSERSAPSTEAPTEDGDEIPESGFADDAHDGGQDGEEEVHHSLPSPEALLAGEGGDIESSTGEATLLQTIAGVAGNVLEWYDFAVFGYFGDIISEVFFPPDQAGHNALVESFAVFGGAFLMRPIGGMLLGYVGDSYGRKRALELSIFLMAFPTFAMGCLPGYKTLGGWSVILLAVVRCLQGMSVGGQLMSSLVFTLEKHHKRDWGLYGSYVLAAANVGTLLGGIVSFALRSSLNEEQLHSWGWRIPFLSGILVSLSGVYLKNHVPEDHTPHAAGPGGPEVSNPVRAAFSRSNIRSLLSASLVPMLWSGGFYLTFVWLSIFMSDLEVPPVPHAFLVNSASLMFSVCALFPVAGRLSDRFGRVRTMKIGGAGVGLLAPFCIYIVGRGGPLGAFAAQFVLGVFLSLWGAPMMAWLVESFPRSARLTSVAIGYNVAQAVAGGFTPAVATLMVDHVGRNSPGFILSGLAVLSLTGLVCAPPRVDGVEVESSDRARTEANDNMNGEERGRMLGQSVDDAADVDDHNVRDGTREIN
uniref:Major facilitator superfamily (MFS) profile domain-containing protein n=1 Tax=Odontella aurita TaxID=265563 RepID=A0A6U6DIP3_9STRA|mmetsp:Transcript_20409/g.59062  ORF Transcript_20409/g.59062 Transcript_20409/m.59062 type:complete len:582 (+) Transcript_20409:264-2009(+)